jgi:pimeloyl-ACP methyl ester carboxylesterase
LAPDLPGHGRSAALPHHPTIAAIADAVAADLDEQEVGTAHVLGNSIGARVALELAARGRARSIVAISPSGLNTPAERAYQGVLMGANRLALRGLRRLVPLAARSVVGRSLLLAGLRSTPWLASEIEALALRDGFADADGFWEMLWWGIITDVPTALGRIDCPVVLAQGTADVIAVGQTPRFLAAVPTARFVPLPGAGHAPQSDTPELILQLVDRTSGAAHRPAALRVSRPQLRGPSSNNRVPRPRAGPAPARRSGRCSGPTPHGWPAGRYASCGRAEAGPWPFRGSSAQPGCSPCRRSPSWSSSGCALRHRRCSAADGPSPSPAPRPRCGRFRATGRPRWCHERADGGRGRHRRRSPRSGGGRHARRRRLGRLPT